MSEKMSFYLNLSESVDNASAMRDQQASLAAQTGIQHQVSDVEKARMGSTSQSGSDPNLPNTTPASRVPIIDEAEYVEVKQQN